MTEKDIHWIQRFDNFSKAFAQLQDAVERLLPYTFDLSIFAQLSDPDFTEHIQRVGLVFYERQ